MVVRCGQTSNNKIQGGTSRWGIEIACRNLRKSAAHMDREVIRRRICVAGIWCVKQISAAVATTTTTKDSTDLVVEILMRYVKTRIGWVLIFLWIVLLV
jgi:hypothetical protein